MRDGTFGMSFPEWFTNIMLAGAKSVLELHDPEPVNYVECALHEPDYTRWTVIVVKPGGKTPHELREEAETERDAALAELATLKGHR